MKMEMSQQMVEQTKEPSVSEVLAYVKRLREARMANAVNDMSEKSVAALLAEVAERE